MTRRKPKPAPADDRDERLEGEPASPATGEPPNTTPSAPEPVAESGGESSPTRAVRPDGPRVPNPFGFRQDAAAGVRLLEDRRFKQVQLKFAEKPSEDVRRAVREGGFRWLQEEGVWAKQIDPDKGWQTRADAEALFERVAARIREEKGVAREHA